MSRPLPTVLLEQVMVVTGSCSIIVGGARDKRDKVRTRTTKLIEPPDHRLSSYPLHWAELRSQDSRRRSIMAESDANQNQKLLTSTPVLLEEKSPENVTVTSSGLLPPAQVQPQAVAQVPVYPTKVYPHSYLIFSTIVAILCGICNLLSITCTIPAVVLSILVSCYMMSRACMCLQFDSDNQTNLGLSVDQTLGLNVLCIFT